MNLKKARHRFAFAPDAVVYWKPRSTIKAALRQFYLYARGNGRIKQHIDTSLRVYVPYAAGLALLISGFFYTPLWYVLLGCAIVYSLNYLWRVVLPYYRRHKSARVFFLVPLVRFITDTGIMAGFALGSIEGLFLRHKYTR